MEVKTISLIGDPQSELEKMYRLGYRLITCIPDIAISVTEDSLFDALKRLGLENSENIFEKKDNHIYIYKNFYFLER